ncbi:uncharacterized protein LOC127831118 [Dreissena polymorpha]|uniref:uncharacterized protein LOC127831118 n=1 Tax=Dreissena polymorpha TaxID=45954 RepID=UPI002263E164|nr:uncharacterized protein LOC127831118 [Dreissena polymorpha]
MWDKFLAQGNSSGQNIEYLFCLTKRVEYNSCSSLFGLCITALLYFFKEFFAMKVINISKLNAKDVEHAETEIRNLKTLSHENLVRYVSDFRKDGGKKICIVMELCDCTLRKYQAEKECGLTEQEVDNLLLQISHGLKVRLFKSDAILNLPIIRN